ncbi:LOW QUALITY PROTEIN: DNA repair protein RAD51 homolog 4 [Lolium rigidum]|uniref:LOW QUALITY PROTEIN: DNA repair protein RAD51 homolog 4 n=1 Tax=Lolium rigidum TaxID=89674 RepID=UPI001F5D13B9|nr:LOW QUALITY PROTEIN: DNA repair protein RAD51 homolog 4 [Lolium rigidum]
MDQDRPPVEPGCVLWSDGMDLLQDAAERKHFLPTGLEGIDTLLGGGLRKGQLTELTGQSSSGKTQACLYSAAHVAARHMGAVLYLDTSNSFSPSRIARILDEVPVSLIKEIILKTPVISKNLSFNLQPKDVRLKRVMSSIICESVFDIFALFEVLNQLEVSLNNKANNGGNKICLLIIDSISSLLAPIIGGKYSQGRSMMISVAMILKKLADKHNLSVLVTNHMVAGNGAPKPALGESWKAVPHIRLMISRDRGSNICTATILKHTLLASGRHMKFAVSG